MARERHPVWKAPAHIPGTPIRYGGEVKPGDKFYVDVGEIWNEDDQWWLGCPCGSGGVLDGHRVLSTDPVTIEPSIVCPAGCHYHIRDGKVV